VWQVENLLRDCLYPVLLGSNTLCHACVRQIQRRYGADVTVLTDKRALTLRFLPTVTLVDAGPALSDEVLLALLSDIGEQSGLCLPLLVLCDHRYNGFVERSRRELEARFILREAGDLLGRGERT
jgi:predicted ATP-grasp superfamily ATP-dependent carboligase